MDELKEMNNKAKRRYAPMPPNRSMLDGLPISVIAGSLVLIKSLSGLQCTNDISLTSESEYFRRREEA